MEQRLTRQWDPLRRALPWRAEPVTDAIREQLQGVQRRPWPPFSKARGRVNHRPLGAPLLSARADSDVLAG